MNTRENLVSNKSKCKVIDEMKNWSPQFRDYYEKCGKKRDIEQFFLSHTYDRKPPEQLIDSLELIGCGHSADCDVKEYRRNDFEDDKFIQIRKSPDVEIREIRGTESSPSPKISVRSNTPGLDVSPEQELQESHAASPGTLSTSKKLEWDSLGDVGYGNTFHRKEQEQEYDIRESRTRSQSPNIPRKLDYKVGDPAAHSTPNIEENTKLSFEKSKSPRKSPTKPTRIFKKSGKYHLSYKSNRPSSLNFDVKKYYSFNVPKVDEYPGSHFEETEGFCLSSDLLNRNTKKQDTSNESSREAEIKSARMESFSADKETQAVSVENACVQTSNDSEKESPSIQYKMFENALKEDLISLSTVTKESSNVLSRAESFEYIPGNVYKNVESAQDNMQDHKNIVKVKVPETARSITSQDILKIFEESKSSDDIGPCLHKISKLLNTHRYEGSSKQQKVVKKIVKILMHTNYPSDIETCSSVTTPSSSSLATTKTGGESISVIEPKDNKQDSNENLITVKDVENTIRNEENKDLDDKETNILNSNRGNIQPNQRTDDVVPSISCRNSSEDRNTDENISDKDNNFSDANDKTSKAEPIKAESFKNVNIDTDNLSRRRREKKGVGKDNNHLQILNDVKKSLKKYVHVSGSHSAPSTLTYSHYLKEKSENVSSCPPSMHHTEFAVPSKSQEKPSKSESSTARSSYRDINIAQENNNTQTDLSKINEEILKLSLLKMKLENKSKTKSTSPLATVLNENANNMRGEMDKGASGDMLHSKSDREPIMVYYNTRDSPVLQEDYTDCVPPLELTNSSSSACSIEVPKVNVQMCSTESKHGSDCSCSCRHKEIDVRNVPSDPQTSGCRFEKTSVRFEESERCDENPHSKSTLPSKCSSLSTCASGLCACCKCKILYSQSSTSSSDSCTEELRKYRKIYDKYQKCVTMKAFVREYDELIKKYKMLKEKQSAQSSARLSEPCRKSEKCICHVCVQTVESKTSTVEKQTCLKQTLDATTCTALSHRSVCCGSETMCINRSTSPLDILEECKTELLCHKCSNADNSEVSERLVGKVRKAFAKEYEDITKRLEHIKCTCECVSKTSILNKNTPQSLSTDVFSSTTTHADVIFENNPFIEMQGNSHVPTSSNSATDDTSECNNNDLGPLSSQEYFILSRKSSQCECVDKCVCTSNSNVMCKETTSNPVPSQECLEINITKCKSCKDGRICKTHRIHIESSSDYTEGAEATSEGTKEIKCKMCQSECCSCAPGLINSSNSEGDICLKNNMLPKKCDCCVQTECSKSKLESSEGVSSARTQTLRFSDSTCTREFQKRTNSSCDRCPGRCNCDQLSSSSKSKDCASKCVCKKCLKKQSRKENSEQVCYTNQSVTTDSAGGTYRKSSKTVTVCQSVMDTTHKNKCSCCKHSAQSGDRSKRDKIICGCKHHSKNPSPMRTKTKRPCSCGADPCEKHEEASDDSVVMCLWCKAIPMNSSCQICNKCLRKHQKYIESVQKKKYLCKSIPKAVAYNLIVESSESILEETIQKNEPKCLKNVIVKVAKVKNKRKDQKGICIEQIHQEEKCSTDEQIRDMSSLNSENTRCCADAHDKCKSCRREERRKRCEPSDGENKTLRDMLEENRPDFVCNANGRQEILKKYNAVRRERDARQRKILLKGVHTLSTINQDALIHLERIAHEHGLFLPKSNDYNFKLFDSKEMVKESKRKYQKLPEIEKKKMCKKKQDYKKTNLLMASVFSKKLQKKTLKGIVDISHSRQVISL